MRLPAAIDQDFFDEAYRLDLRTWRPAIVEVCEAHDLKVGRISPFTDGSNLVAAVDDGYVVKIFPPFHRHQWESERAVLPRLHGRLPVRVPEMYAEGERRDGWLYLIIEKLPGRTLESCRASLDPPQRARLLTQTGATMAAAHDVPIDDAMAALPPAWEAFVQAQQQRCKRRHTALGMPDWFLRDLDAFVGRWAPRLAGLKERVLLTGEYTPFNLLLQQDADGWHLTGMIDFGDAMVGPRAYDLLGPSLFCCAGHPTLVDALFRGYYGEGWTLDQEARVQLMALAVLHRYANFDMQIRIPGWRDRVDSLEGLAALIWPQLSDDVGERRRTSKPEA